MSELEAEPHPVRWWLDARDKPALLSRLMTALAGPDSFISFEGNLSRMQLNEIPSATRSETPHLKRQTRKPILDFLVIPLNDDTLPALQRQVLKYGVTDLNGVVHVQIGNVSRLLFGGYDNFHRDCVVAYEGVSDDLLDDLLGNGILRGKQAAKSGSSHE